MSPRNPAKTTSPATHAELVETFPDEVESTSVAVAEPPKAEPPKKTTPPKKKPATLEPSDLIGEEIAREKRLSLAREELAFRRHELLKAGEELSPGEMQLLLTAYPRSATENIAVWRKNVAGALAREDARVDRVIGLQSAAGTPDDRTAADKLAVETAADRDKQVPGIEDQIRELQNQVGALNQAATSAKSAADARHDADKKIRDPRLLPSFVRDELDAMSHRHTHDFAHALVVLETRQIQLTGILSIDDSTPEGQASIKAHLGGCDRFGPDNMARLIATYQYSTEQRPGGVAHRFGNLRADVWGSYLEDLRTELADVESRIDEITNGPQADGAREVESLKAFYVLG